MVFQQTPVLCWPEVSAKGCLVTNVGGLGPPGTLSYNISRFARLQVHVRNPETEANLNFHCDHCDDFFPKVVSKIPRYLAKVRPDISAPRNIENEASLHLKLPFRMGFSCLSMVFCLNVWNFLPFQFPVPTKKTASFHWMYPSQVIYHWTGGFEGFLPTPCKRKGTKYICIATGTFFPQWSVHRGSSVYRIELIPTNPIGIIYIIYIYIYIEKSWFNKKNPYDTQDFHGLLP